MSIVKEFFKSIARTFGRIVAYALIGTLIYFIASNFVHASVQYRTLNGSGGVSSWTNWTTSTGDISNTGIKPTTNGKTIYQFRDNTAFASGKYYDLYMEFEYSSTNISSHSNIDIVNTIFIEVYNGTTLKSIASQCATNYVQTDTTGGSSGLYRATHKIVGTFTCTGVSGTGYYPYIGFAVRSNYDDSNQTASSTLNIKNWSYTLNTKATETNDIINNNNNNTQSIINNNNYNTQQITDSIDSASESVANSIDSLADSITSTESPTISLPQDPFNFTGVEGIFLLPITIAQSYSTTCTPYTFQLFGKNITFPCINLENYLGSTLWGIIDALFIFGITIGLANLIRRVYISFTSLSDDIYVEYYGRPETYGDMQDYIRRHGGGSD